MIARLKHVSSFFSHTGKSLASKVEHLVRENRNAQIFRVAAVWRSEAA